MSDKLIIYRCYFKLFNHMRSVDSKKGIGAFTEGFWVTKSMELSTGEQIGYWIPPSQIDHIERVTYGIEKR